jgi:hypothetical protein
MSIAPQSVRARPLLARDIDAAGDILYEAFGRVYAERGFRAPFPSPEAGAWLAHAYLDLDPAGAVAVERAGRLDGVGFVHVRGPVGSIGPVASRPGAPPGIGRALMEALIQISERSGARVQRLFQDAFNPRSFALYAKLGFLAREVVAYAVADPPARVSALPPPGTTLRELRMVDVDAAARLDRDLVLADRRADFELILRTGGGWGLWRGGALSAYLFFREGASRVALAPGAAASLPGDLVALVRNAIAQFPDRALSGRLPASTPAVLGELLALGFRVDHIGNLMTRGPERRSGFHLHAMFPESL